MKTNNELKFESALLALASVIVSIQGTLVILGKESDFSPNSKFRIQMDEVSNRVDKLISTLKEIGEL